MDPIDLHHQAVGRKDRALSPQHPLAKRPTAQASRNRCKKTVLFFECFPYVCPGPVLVLNANNFWRRHLHVHRHTDAPCLMALVGRRMARSFAFTWERLKEPQRFHLLGV